jgi:hypothetical protein
MASSRHTLRLALTTPQWSAESGGSVLLEQESMDPYTGHLTKLQALAWMRKIAFGGDDPASNCPGDGPGYEKALYAYPWPIDLRYRAHLSSGTMTGPIVEQIEFTELVQCNLTRQPALRYPAMSITSHEWVGDTYAATGEIVPRPQVTIRNNLLRLSAEVYGSLRVSYMVCRHTYLAAVQPRVQYAEQVLQAFLVAVWSGGTAYIELEAPATAEDGECDSRWNPGTGAFDYLLGGVPGSGSSIDGGTEDDDDYGPVPAEDETVYIDYCTQQELT